MFYHYYSKWCLIFLLEDVIGARLFLRPVLHLLYELLLSYFSHLFKSTVFYIYLFRFLFSFKIEMIFAQPVRRRRTWLPLPVQGLLSRTKMMFNFTCIAMPSFQFVQESARQPLFN